MRWRTFFPWALPAGVLLTLLARWFPGVVETLYSRGVYRVVAASFACLFGWVPFSVGEPLLVAAVVGALWWLARLIRRLVVSRGTRLGVARAGARTFVFAVGVGYLAFLLFWGLNYHRRPLATNLALEADGASVEELVALCETLVEEANAQRAAAGALGEVDYDDVRAAYEAFAEKEPLVRGFFGRPKPAFFSGLLSRFGVTGIYWPFTGEPHLNTTLPPAIAPATAAHELAHQRGVASEGGASFVGILACRMAPSPATRYSGTFCALVWALSALARGDPVAHSRSSAALSAPVRADMEALSAWRGRHSTRVMNLELMELGQKVNDVYLRANSQAEGVRSYGSVVDLLLAERHRAGQE